MSVSTCPKCGALIAPTLPRCRQCGHYLHGTAASGWLGALLPPRARRFPASTLFGVGAIVAYVATVLVALPASPFGFSVFTLRQMGATYGVGVNVGELWRLVTSLFVHHDLVHLSFNLWALAVAGPAVEQLFDRKKAWAVLIVGGAISMGVSHVYYTAIGATLYTSAGASGAICALIGAAWIGARKFTPPQPHIEAGMRRWCGMLLIFGFIVPGINNAAHIGGLVAGAALGAVMGAGPPRSVRSHRGWSVIALSLGGLVLVSFVAAGLSASGMPGSLRDDLAPGRIVGIELATAPQIEDSAQADLAVACEEAPHSASLDERRRRCELAIRSMVSGLVYRTGTESEPVIVRLLRHTARLYDEGGDDAQPTRARLLRAVAERARL